MPGIINSFRPSRATIEWKAPETISLLLGKIGFSSYKASVWVRIANSTKFISTIAYIRMKIKLTQNQSYPRANLLHHNTDRDSGCVLFPPNSKIAG